MTEQFESSKLHHKNLGKNLHLDSIFEVNTSKLNCFRQTFLPCNILIMSGNSKRQGLPTQ